MHSVECADRAVRCPAGRRACGASTAPKVCRTAPAWSSKRSDRHRGTELRPPSRRAGCFLVLGGRRANDYVGKGLSGSVLAVPRSPTRSRFKAPRERHHWQYVPSLRRHDGEGLLRRTGRERFAVLRQQRRRHGRRRGGRSRLRVHDRRRRRRPRAHGAKLCGWNERGASLTCSTTNAPLSGPHQQGDGSISRR